MKNPLLTGLCALLGVLLWSPSNAADLSGTYTIDKNGSGTTNFTSFSAAVDALNTNKVTGPVIFKVADGIYKEQIRVEPYYGASAANPVRFESASGDNTKVILTWPSSSSPNDDNYTLELHLANYVSFNKMTIARSGNETYSTTVQVDNNKEASITNCILLGPTNATASTSIINAVIYTNADANTHLVIDNNLIRGGQYGIYLWDKDLLHSSESLVIQNNKLDSATTAEIMTRHCTDPNIIGNTITMKNGGFGIYITKCFFSNGASIAKNKIASPSSTAGVGIFAGDLLSFDNSPFIVIANNFISMAGDSGTIGIWASMAPDFQDNGSYFTIYHNNINLTGSAHTIKGISVSSDYSSSYDVINNSIACTGGYAVYAESGDMDPFINCDHNNLYAPGAHVFRAADMDFETLDDWRNTSGLDVNSVSEDPGYTSATDLHVSAPALNGTGMYVGIDDDIDGDTRDQSTPDIGADEFSATYPDAGISAFESLSATYCHQQAFQPILVRLKNYGTVPVKSAVITWTMNSSTMKTITWRGDLAPGKDTVISIDTFSFAQPSVSDITAFTTLVNGVTDLDPSNDKTTFKVTIYAVDAGFTYVEHAGNSITFTVNDNSLATISWDFGDGKTSTADAPTHAYSSPGTYLVTHTAAHTSPTCLTSVAQEVVVTGTVGIKDEPAITASLKTYPNPFSSDVTVEYTLNESVPVTMQVLDISGRVISEYKLPIQTAGSHSYNLDGSSLKAGMYFLKLDTGKGSTFTRIMKK